MMTDEERSAIFNDVKMILMGADTTGMSPKSHAWVDMDLLWRIYRATERKPGELRYGTNEHGRVTHFQWDGTKWKDLGGLATTA